MVPPSHCSSDLRVLQFCPLSLEGKAQSDSNPVFYYFIFPTPLITGSREIFVKVWRLNHLNLKYAKMQIPGFRISGGEG